MSDHNLSGLKPAPFWLDDPALWFAQIEAQFWYHNVKDDLTKFNYIITQLDKHCLTVVKDEVLTPPVENKYETLKFGLLSKLKESKIKNIKEILMVQEIGDRKPSEFLHYLKDLAGPEVQDDYIKSVWTSRLPEKVQWVSSFLTSSSLEKIAQLADLAMNSPSIKEPTNKCQAKKDTDTKLEVKEDDAMKDLTKRVEDLTMKIDTLSSKSINNETQELTKKSNTKTASTLSLSQSSIYVPKKEHKLDPLILCWYHDQFGWKATKCVKPCNFNICSLTLF